LNLSLFNFRNITFWSASLGPLKSLQIKWSVAFPSSLLGCFDFWAWSLPKRGHFTSFYRKVLSPEWCETRSFVWNLAPKCFISRFFAYFCVNVLSTEAAL